MGGRPVWVCRTPPRVPTRDTPTVVLASGGMADPKLGTRSSGGFFHPHPVSGVRACLRRVAGRDVVGGIAIGVRSRGDGAWIPAFAGMTRWGAGGEQVAGLWYLRRHVGDGIAIVVPTRDVRAWIPAFAGMTKRVVGVFPGSESGRCFHNNCSCWLAPAHQGMKSRGCGLVQQIGMVDSATPHPDPSGGQAPRLAIWRFAAGESSTGMPYIGLGEIESPIS